MRDAGETSLADVPSRQRQRMPVSVSCRSHEVGVWSAGTNSAEWRWVLPRFHGRWDQGPRTSEMHVLALTEPLNAFSAVKHSFSEGTTGRLPPAFGILKF